MKSYFILPLLITLSGINFSYRDKKIQEETRTISFDENWRFTKDSLSGAEEPSFDDSRWRPIDLPHDWSIEDLPNQSDSVIGPFSKASFNKMRTGYTIGGTA